MKQRQWFWVTRDAGSDTVVVWHGNKEPKRDDNGRWWAGSSEMVWYYRQFEGFFGVVIEEDSCQKIAFSVEVVA